MPIMESTTLVTFMLQHGTARSVELLGSWDNFAEAYSMKRDSRRGHGYWTGCHTFRDIICDGDLADIHEGRNGGLKMGGTYWYFYRIDHDEEFYDPSQPSTSSCPLMPGQDLNILDVPYDTERFVSRSRSSSISISNAAQTLNPDDRYKNPRPAPKPQLPRLVTSAEVATALKFDYPQSGVNDRARSAIGPRPAIWHSRTRSWDRDIKSAASSPSTTLKSAFMHLKGPASALTPSEGGRGRSRTLKGDHERHHRTKSPSIKELKRQISRPRAIPSPMDRPLEQSNSPIEMRSERDEPLSVRKRSQSSHKYVRRIQQTYSTVPVPEIFPDHEVPVPRGRTVSDRERNVRPNRISHRRGFSENFISRRSKSIGRAREPSPLRNMVTAREQIQAVDALQIPTGIPELDNEDVVSPRKAPTELDLSGSKSSHVRRCSEPATPTVAPGIETSSPDYNKDLPTLPSYLVPQPLFGSSEHNDMEAALQALSEQYPQSISYSPWGSEIDIPLPESPDSETEAAGSESHSPTFSSIRGDTSGASTPNKFLEISDWPLRTTLGDESGMDLIHGFDGMSIHARTASTTSTVPYSLPPGYDGNPFAEKVAGPHEESRELTQMEQLLDEFDYLGAALI